MARIGRTVTSAGFMPKSRLARNTVTDVSCIAMASSAKMREFSRREIWRALAI
jgi:hypothetical protein